jgi:hypothetical protein
VRVEVQAAKSDSGLIRALAATLRDEPERAKTLRATLARALNDPEVQSAFDIFGSSLPDDTFDGIFDQPREKNWREMKF